MEIESISTVADIGADSEETRRLQDMLKGFTIRKRCAESGLAQVIDVYEVWRGYQGQYVAERWDRACPGKLNHFEIKKDGWWIDHEIIIAVWTLEYALIEIYEARYDRYRAKNMTLLSVECVKSVGSCGICGRNPEEAQTGADVIYLCL